MKHEASAASRVETDSLGAIEVPAGAYWGASTERARRNFQVSGLRLPARFVRAIALIKREAARGQRRAGRGAGGGRGGDRGGGAARSSTAKPRRPVSARRVPDRLRHLDQHERQRGDREPRDRAAGRRARLEEAGASQRSRQRVAVVERRDPDRDPCRRVRRDRRGARAGARGSRRDARRQGERVRPLRQDRPHPPAGRGADPAGAGVLRLRAADRERGRAPRGRASRAWPSSRSAAPRWAPASTRRPGSPTA